MKSSPGNQMHWMPSLLLAVLMLTTTSAFAVDEIYTGYFSNTAIKGYDTVAYFTENKPVKGSSKFEYSWKGANWHFSSQENLDLFKANPEKYAPQYGGWCAYAVAQNTTASIEPDLFTIVDDKLYLNYSNKINKKWLANRDEYIIDADKNWPGVLDK